jgi:nucleotide-binding universal stress UspA family protein
MRRILVPLDGSDLSASIIPNARKLAGPDGELILVHDILPAVRNAKAGDPSPTEAIDHGFEYLEGLALSLRALGLKVRVDTLVIADTAVAIDEAARIFKVDMVACATHGRGPLGRLVRGGVAWRAVANSPVPVLLRHVDEVPHQMAAVMPDRIMVPIDGSAYSETALPLAAELAEEWNAEIVLTQVVPNIHINGAPFTYDASGTIPEKLNAGVKKLLNHLVELSQKLPVRVDVEASAGPVIDSLVESIGRNKITHVVMASHGRTGIPRAVVGSVTDGLIHRVHLPIIVIPALLAKEIETKSRELETVPL